MSRDYLECLTRRLKEFPEQRRADCLAEESRRRQVRPSGSSPTERRVLVIGGAGYIGSVLVPELLGDGYNVLSADLLIYENGPLALAHWFNPHYTFHRLDLRDESRWDAVLTGISDVVILGALVGDPITKKYPVQSQQINVDALKSLLLRLDRAGANKVVFVSTCSNYGLQSGDTPADEEASLNPLSLYAKNKVEIEMFLQERSWNFHHTILRFSTAFGLSPRMRFDLTVNEFTRDVFHRRDLLVYDPDTWRPYCHVRDLSRAVRRVLDYPVKTVGCRVFNTGGDANNHTKRSIVNLIQEALPGAIVAYKDHGSDPRNYRVSFARIRTALDFEPEFSVADGIRELSSALARGVFHDADERPDFHGNRSIPLFEREALDGPGAA